MFTIIYLGCSIEALAIHIINNTTLDFSFQPHERKEALNKAKQFFNEEIIPCLTRRFDETQLDIYIDKLEIDIGKTTEQDFGKNFYAAFIRALEKTSYKNQQSPALLPQVNDAIISDPVLYFLQKGYWPWNLQHKTEQEILAHIARIWEDQDTIIRLLEQVKATGHSIAERLIRLVMANSSLFTLFMNALKRHHTAWEQTVLIPAEKWHAESFAEESVYFLLLKELLLSPPLHTVADVKVFLWQLMYKYIDKNKLHKHQQGILQQLTLLLNTPGHLADTSQVLSAIQQLLPGKENATGQKHPPASTQASPGPRWFSDDENEKINIGNAGLVLFHHYLPYVFRDLKWITRDNQFRDIKSQQKAILFLQYVINGKSRQAEHELVLNKLLCNWPPSLPLATRCNFSAIEKQAAGELVDSLKEHWAILNTTSRPGVIQSFIERKGIVRKTGKDYLLQVEKNTIDILMESLPFGIQLIKLPWNEYLIHTEWVH